MGTRRPTHRLEFSQRAIEKLPFPKAGRVHHYDAKEEGIGVRVEPTRKSFFWFRKIRGTPTFRMIGQYPSTSVEKARATAKEWNGDLAEYKRHGYDGDNPFERQRGVPTLGEIFADERRLSKSKKVKDPARAAKAAKYIFDKHLASWRDRKLSSIRRKEVIDLHQTLGEQAGPYAANRALEILKSLLNYAIDSELWAGPTGASKIEKFTEEKRDRYLQPDEIARLYKALEEEPSRDLIDFVRLALHTGARKGDVYAMRWADISVNVNREWQWRVPSPKNNRPYVIPLVPEAVKVLSDRRRLIPQSSEWVFPSVGASGHVIDLKKRWKDLLKRAKIQNLRVHDLRRSLGSWQAAQGTSLLIVGKSLGHASMQSTEVYSQLNLDPIRESVTQASRAMLAASKRKPRALGEASHA